MRNAAQLHDSTDGETTMNLRRRKALKAIAIFFAFCFAQVYVHGALPETTTPAASPQRQITARLTTKNNQPITVNGNQVGTGATLLTGATIETPDQVSGVIDLGDAGVVEIQPNSTIKLDFDADGNVHVKVIRGCAVTRKKTNVLPGEMELYTDQASEKTDKKRRHLAGCILPNGQLGSFGGGISGAALGGIGAAAGGGAIIAAVLTRGGTMSGSTP
ncbi:MAG TPA: hypothetical protein VE863_14920 [Pyrinomonadaceae bacterium]|jgi:hypothetical protein|nr:hypothetical protein [Pyrinomonadaceae bacterium]